jgi:hypothetical protein
MKPRWRIGRTINLLAWGQLAAVVLMIAAYNGYCWFFNTSNHVGFFFFKLLGQYYLLFFVLSSLELVLAVKYKTLYIKKNVLMLIMAFAVLGVLNIIVYDKLNIMMYYDDWIRRGMPDKPLSDALRRWL